jgi:NAD(P)-dependent dehydrogenase (short-subunit alcohol dehydrogenase family)
MFSSLLNAFEPTRWPRQSTCRSQSRECARGCDGSHYEIAAIAFPRDCVRELSLQCLQAYLQARGLAHLHNEESHHMPESRVAIVTGGSRGIGRATVVALAAAGHRVLFTYHNREDEARSLEQQVRAAHGQARAHRADAADRSAARAVVDAALSAYGAVDVLVNNAGVHVPGVRLADLDAADWQYVLDVNVNGPFHMIQAVLPHMRSRKRGHIITISSNATVRLPAGNGVYTISKVAIEAMTKVLSKEEGPHGIRVNAVAPGPIRTDMLAESLAKLPPEKADAFIRSIPLGRIGEPHEIAAVIAFIVSDAASYMTGQVVFVNGGGPAG